MTTSRAGDRALLRSVWLPSVFLTVALLGGLRVGAQSRAFVFVAPPLVTLILAALLSSLLIRGKLLSPGRWLSSGQTTLANVSHALTLLTLFFASAQAFNSVLPERGLFHWLFALMFLWTLWNNQFSAFDARRLLRSLAVLFGTAFVLKHLLLANLYAPSDNWLRRLTGAVVEGASFGALDAPSFAPITGYISFFTLALYVLGLLLMIPAEGGAEEESSDRGARRLMRDYENLAPAERARVRRALIEEALAEKEEPLSLPETKKAALDAEAE